jgi:hypothetical protein
MIYYFKVPINIYIDKWTGRPKDDIDFGYVIGQWKEALSYSYGEKISHGYIIPKDKFEKYNRLKLFMNLRAEEINSDYQI